MDCMNNLGPWLFLAARGVHQQRLPWLTQVLEDAAHADFESLLQFLEVEFKQGDGCGCSKSSGLHPYVDMTRHVPF
uniref:Uncharacterized protein n=1 Tax=Arundo donax TaxID=35708 RepID=A0A0A9GMQ5_ARUDO